MNPRYCPKLVDTHCHINESPLIENLSNVLEKCQQVGVDTMVAIGTDLETSQMAIQLSQQHPSRILATVGIHPQITEIVYTKSKQYYLDIFRQWLETTPIIAIGEIGLDFEVSTPSVEVQEQRFKEQLHLAYQYKKPVLLHCRDAFGRLQSIIEEFCEQYGYSIGGILHSWAGSLDSLQFFLKRGFYYGVSGVVTQPYATKRRKIIAESPLEAMVLETDAPYIRTHSIAKGKVFPYHLPEIARTISELHQVSYQTVCEKTTENAKTILHIRRVSE